MYYTTPKVNCQQFFGIFSVMLPCFRLAVFLYSFVSARLPYEKSAQNFIGRHIFRKAALHANLSLSNSLHRHNLLPSLVEGGGKIEDFDGGSFAITHITPSVCFADSSLLACRLRQCFCFAEVSTGHPHPLRGSGRAICESPLL